MNPSQKRDNREIGKVEDKIVDPQENDTRPRKSKVPSTIRKELEIRDTNSPIIEEGEISINKIYMAIKIMVEKQLVKFEPILATFEVSEERDQTSINGLEDPEEEILAKGGPSKISPEFETPG